MRDAILHYIPNEERGEINTDDRIYQIEPVVCRLLKRACEQHHYLVDDPVKRKGSYC